MKVPQSHSTGNIGKFEVCANFVRIGWGAQVNESEDFGIDVFAMAHDREGYERALLVGLQVKSGESYFGEEVVEKGEVVGWVNRPTTEHLGYWINMAMPMLIVLHDLETRASYWVQVTKEAAASSGKGWKIFVPRSQKVDEASRDQLFAIACKQRDAIELEGSAWSVARAPVDPTRLWRHALIAPRLVAPHGNAGVAGPLDPYQAAALVIEGRRFDIKRYSEEFPGSPALGQAANAEDWAWRFVGALATFIDGGPEAATGVVDDAPTRHGYVAAAVVGACALARADRHPEALELLRKAIEQPGATEAADLAWLKVQCARFTMEVGDVKVARDLAMTVLQIIAGEPPDVTVSAIAAAASWLLWTTSQWEHEAFAEAVQKADTVVSWWRSQVSAAALRIHLDRTYDDWAGSTATTFSNGDVVAIGLEQAMTTADLSGEHGSFLGSARALAKYQLTTAWSDEDLTRAGLVIMRRIGDTAALELAIRHLLALGPVEPVKTVAEEVGPASWNHTSAPTNLAVWHLAGELMTPEHADEAIEFCAKEFAAGPNGSRIGALGPTFHVRRALVQAMTGLAAAASSAGRSSALEALTSALGGALLEGRVATELPNLVGWLSLDSASASVRRAWEEEATKQGKSWPASSRVLAELATASPTAAKELLRLAAEGDLRALALIPDLRELSANGVEGVINTLRVAVDNISRAARTGSIGIGRFDYPATLAVLNVTFPEQAAWEDLLGLLAEPTVSERDKGSVCVYLSANAADIPPKISGRLSDLKNQIEQGVVVPIGSPTYDLQAAAFGLSVAIGALPRDAYQASLAALLSSGLHDRRRTAAQILGFAVQPTDADVSALTTLLGDAVPGVRGAAAQGLGRQVGRGFLHPAAIDALRRALSAPGLDVTYEALNGLAAVRSVPLPPVVREVLSEVSVLHPSSKVRSFAARVLRWKEAAR